MSRKDNCSMIEAQCRAIVKELCKPLKLQRKKDINNSFLGRSRLLALRVVVEIHSVTTFEATVNMETVSGDEFCLHCQEQGILLILGLFQYQTSGIGSLFFHSPDYLVQKVMCVHKRMELRLGECRLLVNDDNLNGGR